MYPLKTGQHVLVIWESVKDGDKLQTTVEELKKQTGPTGNVTLENVHRLSMASYPMSTFDIVLSGVIFPQSIIHTTELLGEILRLVKPKGTVILREAVVQLENSSKLKSSAALNTTLKISGLTDISEEKTINLQDEEIAALNEILASDETITVVEVSCKKPNFEVGSSSKLSFAKQANGPSESVAAVWKLADTIDDDIIDSDNLLDEEDLKKPDPASLKDMMVAVPVLDDPFDMTNCMPMQIDGRDISNFKLAYYDIETSGLTNSSHVIQIAAYVDGDMYSAYVMPPYIPKRVSEVTGLTIRFGSLNLNSRPVATVTKKEAWTGLIRFLSKFGSPFILVGHNVSFDLRFTLKEISECDLDTDFLKIVYGSSNTLKLLKKVLPNMLNYRQGTIADHLSAWDMSGAGAHNAIGDVRTLKNIIDKLAITDVMIKENCQSIISQMAKKRKVADCKTNAETLQPLKDCVGLSETMVKKIASAGINLKDIEDAVNQNGEDGIRILFTQNCNNRPKVTKNEKVIKNVLSYFKRQSEDPDCQTLTVEVNLEPLVSNQSDMGPSV